MTTIDTAALERDGFAIVPCLLEEGDVCALLRAFSEDSEGGTAAAAAVSLSRRGGSDGGVYAIRNVLEVPAVRALAQSPTARASVEPVLGPACFAVRGILFDKTQEANWKVVWHQDLSIAVRRRTENPQAAGWGPWSEKAGVPHVQPPAGLLARMLAVRLHLDACGVENGPLRVLPGTHRMGRLDAEAIARLRGQIPEVVCSVPRGGALLMRPLLLHASSAARQPGHRRVLHIEWAAEPLPGGLEWHTRIPKGE